MMNQSWTCTYLDSNLRCHLCLCAQVEITNIETLVRYVVQAPNFTESEENKPSPDDVRRANLKHFNIPDPPEDV